MLSPIFYVVGVLLNVLGAAMLFPMFVDIYHANPDWQAFMFAAFITFVFGNMLMFTNTAQIKSLSLKQTFLLTAVTWIVLALFAALPFMLSNPSVTLTDAYFEAMSGLTTTGATVMNDLDEQPPGVLIWRSLLQWMGGIGIVVLAMAVLPVLKIGGMQLFRSESSDKSEKVLPRARQIASATGGIYMLLTIGCFLSLWMAGMTSFDAINHAMATVATGGFSTHDKSVGYFDNIAIERVIILFMVLSALPLVLYIQLVKGYAKPLYRDTQVHWFLGLWAAFIILMTLWLVLYNGYQLSDAFRYASFNVTSVITTTGYATADYYLWGSFSVLVFFMMTVVGGCTGSTTGGIKVFRFHVLYQIAHSQVKQLIQPHGIFRPQFNRRPISEEAASAVLTFFILFAFCFTVLAILLSTTGLNYITSMSAAATALANVGPGLGATIGPTGNFAPLNDVAKWLISAGMLIGRLEIFTVLILFSPSFWRS